MADVGRTLVLARSLFTGRATIEPGALIISGSTIEAVGTPDELRRRGPFASVIGSIDRCDVIPGLVNAHHHSLRPNRARLVEGPLELHLLQLRRRRLPALSEEEERDHTLWGALALLRTGVTTVIDCYPPNPTLPQYGLPVGIDAYLESGMRVAMCIRCSDQASFTYENDDIFLGRLPGPLSSASRAKSRPFNRDTFFATCEAVADEYDGRDGRVRIGYGPVGDQWCSDELLEAVRREAHQRDAPVQMHLLESPYQAIAAERSYGTSALERLQRLRFLNPFTSLAHAVWVTAEEIETIRDAGATIVNNPASNLTMGNGIAPVAQMLAMGCRVGLGLDANGFEQDFDMFREMRLALLLQQLPGWGRSQTSATDVLSMATSGGATATAFHITLGSLSVGAAADLVVLEHSRLRTSPYKDRTEQFPMLLVESGLQEAVMSVIVAGRVVLERTKQSEAKFAEVESRVRQSVARFLPLLEDADSEFRGLVPHLDAYFSNFDLAEDGILLGDRSLRPVGSRGAPRSRRLNDSGDEA